MSDPTRPAIGESEIVEQDESDDDLATLLKRREHARPNRLTWVLLTVLILGIGFIGGAYASERWGTSTGTSGGIAFAGLPAGLPAGMPAGFPGAPAGAAAGAATGTASAAPTTASGTTGTVKLVDGRKLYVTDTSGATVIVTVPKTATVTASSDVALADLSAGASVVIQGEIGADGSVTATSVAQTSTTATQGEN